MHSAQHFRATRRVFVRDWWLALGYLGAFLLLDWMSFIHPFRGLNITPWNPQPALAVALLLRRPRWIPLVWCGLLLADVTVRGMPANWLPGLAATAAMALTYAAIARAAHMKLGHGLPSSRTELYWFSGITVGGALLAATVYVGTVAVAAIDSRELIFQAIGRYWVGDGVGLVVTLPILLMAMDPQRRASLASALRRLDLWLAFLAVALLIVLVFGVDHGDYFRFFYVLMLPVIWAAASMGLTGAILVSALTQAGLIAAIRSVSNADLTVFEMQALMAAITMTGLMLGVTVDERERTAAELKRTLRMAAAGQMAAALAHELSQPLTALNTYAEASRALTSTAGISDQERLHRLADISSRMASEAVRASDVVKRLRDFFRAGSTQLQRVHVDALLRECVAANGRRAEALGIQVSSLSDVGGVPVLIDPVQIAVVLRNLLANALDAVADTGGAREVAVRATAQGDSVLVEVTDSGPGVSEERLHTLFEPGTSDKPAGMGVGLSICRAIIEAHGGELWALPGGSGHFCFTLPLDPPDRSGARHAPRDGLHRR